jgi:hypothetical protein
MAVAVISTEFEHIADEDNVPLRLAQAGVSERLLTNSALQRNPAAQGYRQTWSGIHKMPLSRLRAAFLNLQPYPRIRAADAFC